MDTKFVWESKGGFVKAPVRSAVLLGEGPLTDCPLYYWNVAVFFIGNVELMLRSMLQEFILFGTYAVI